MVRGLSRVLEFRSNDSVVSVFPPLPYCGANVFFDFSMYVRYTVNFAESVNTLQEDMKEISPTAFLNVPRIWEKMHSNIMIRMQDAVFFKRWVFKAMLPIGGRVSQYRLENKRVPLYWRFLHWLAYLLLFRALKTSRAFANPHLRQWSRPSFT